MKMKFRMVGAIPYEVESWPKSLLHLPALIYVRHSATNRSVVQCCTNKPRSRVHYKHGYLQDKATARKCITRSPENERLQPTRLVWFGNVISQREISFLLCEPGKEHTNFGYMSAPQIENMRILEIVLVVKALGLGEPSTPQ